MPGRKEDLLKQGGKKTGINPHVCLMYSTRVVSGSWKMENETSFPSIPSKNPKMKMNYHPKSSSSRSQSSRKMHLLSGKREQGLNTAHNKKEEKLWN